jgi:hypothetical protein
METGANDAGTGVPDAKKPGSPDTGGTPTPDVGGGVPDSGSQPDVTTPVPEAGVDAPSEAATPMDTGTPPHDTGTPDTGHDSGHDSGPPPPTDAGAGCLQNIPASCPDCMTQNASDMPICEKYIQCYITNSCNPNDACGQNSGICGVNTVGGGSAPESAAVATYNCACP